MHDLQTSYLTLRIFVVHRLRPRLSIESLTRGLRINNLLEIEHIWARLHTLDMLGKVGLLPQTIVQSVEALIELGEYFKLHIRIF